MTPAKPMTERPDDQVVCPQCWRPIGRYEHSMSRVQPSRCRPDTRSYHCWCVACNHGAEVIQFRSDERTWMLHKWREYRGDAQAGGSLSAAGPWHEINPLPPAPPVLLGPGGDYDRAPNLDQEVKLLQETQTLLAMLAATAQNFARAIGQKIQDHKKAP